MLHAIGVGARRNPDNSITVQVKILDDDGTLVKSAPFTAPNLNAVKDLIQAELLARKQATTDAALQAAVVGVELASI